MLLPTNFVQSIDSAVLAKLPKLATYEGEEPALRQFRGTYFPTTQVESLIPVGERENVWVEEDGLRWQPWKHVQIVELGPDGAPVWHHEPLPKDAGKGMSIGDLGSLGLSDQDLIDLARELLGETYEPDRPGPSEKRADVYRRVLAAGMR